MPRPPRLHVPGALYYITSRGLAAQPIFRDARDYDTFLELLQAYKPTHQFKLFAFALLPDHLHLCLEVTGAATVSAIMHDLNSRYTKYVNKRHQRSGHVFQERFRAVVAEKDPYLLRLTRYIHSHARAPEARTSVPMYRNGGSLLVEAAEVLGHFRSEEPQRAHEQFLASATPEELQALRLALQHPFVGSDDFVASLKQQASAPRPLAWPAEQPDMPALPFDDPEPDETELVPVPVRPAAAPRAMQADHPPVRGRHLLSAAATLSVVVSIGMAAYLSNRAMTLAGKRVEVIVHQMASAPKASPDMLGQTLPTGLTRPAIPQHLNGTAWEIRLKPADAANDAAAQQDLIEFSEGRVKSWGMSAQGFPLSNYTLTLQPNGVVVWETMQTGPRGEVASWRGEWDGRTMRGILTRQEAGGQARVFQFIGAYRGDHETTTTRENI